MTRNLRTQLADLAERWLNNWGHHLTREQASLLLKSWDLAEPWDDETTAEVLGRFPASEPPAVPFVDFLPADMVETAERDGKQIVAEVLPVREECADPDCHNFGGLPEVCGTGPLFWENDFHICPTCRKPRANSWTTHCDTCDGPAPIVSGGEES